MLVITVVVDTGALKDALVRYTTYGVTYSTLLLGSGQLNYARTVYSSVCPIVCMSSLQGSWRQGAGGGKRVKKTTCRQGGCMHAGLGADYAIASTVSFGGSALLFTYWESQAAPC